MFEINIHVTGLEPLQALADALRAGGAPVQKIAEQVAERVQEAAQPVQFTPVPSTAPASVPVSAAPSPTVTPAPVAAPPAVSLDQIKVALAALADSGRSGVILQLFGQYGIQCADDLTPDKLTAFACDLRQQGGVI